MENDKIIEILEEFMDVLKETLHEDDETDPRVASAMLGEKAKPEQESHPTPPPAPAPGNLGWRKSLSLKFQTYGNAMCKRADRWWQALDQSYADPFTAPSLIKWNRLATTILGAGAGILLLPDTPALLHSFNLSSLVVTGAIAGGAIGYCAGWGLDTAARYAAKPFVAGLDGLGACIRSTGNLIAPKTRQTRQP